MHAIQFPCAKMNKIKTWNNIEQISFLKMVYGKELFLRRITNFKKWVNVYRWDLKAILNDRADCSPHHSVDYSADYSADCRADYNADYTPDCTAGYSLDYSWYSLNITKKSLYYLTSATKHNPNIFLTERSSAHISECIINLHENK